MNYIWGAMILIGIVWGTINGNVEAVSDAVLSSAKEAVTLCITMLGVMGLWTGLMEIAKDAGIIHGISKKIQPLIRFLFPEIPDGHPVGEHITMNCVANFLGLGWAATPAGLRAMESLAELEEERRKESNDLNAAVERKGVVDRKGVVERKDAVDQSGTVNVKRVVNPKGMERYKQKRSKVRVMPKGVASNEMCTFLILNISSLQLIPVNVIAYRSQYGSVNPTAIVGPGILATAVSTGVAIAFSKIMDRGKKV